MRYGRVAGDLLAEIVTLPEGQALADLFHADLLPAFVPLGDGPAEPGWRYEGGDFLPPLPPEPTPPTPIRVITARQFRERFTRAERVAITLAASQALEAGDAELQVFLDDLSASQVAELDHPDLIAGVQALVTAGLISAARAAEILSTAP